MDIENIFTEDTKQNGMKDKTLHEILLQMKKRAKEFKELMGECWRRDRADGIREGWLSKGEIALFENDIEKLIEESLKAEKES